MSILVTQWKGQKTLVLLTESTNTHALESSVANIQSLAEVQEPFRPLMLDGS